MDLILGQHPEVTPSFTISGTASSPVNDTVRRQHVFLHDGGAAVRTVRQGWRRQEDHHGPRQVQTDTVWLLLRRVLRQRGR